MYTSESGLSSVDKYEMRTSILHFTDNDITQY